MKALFPIIALIIGLVSCGPPSGPIFVDDPPPKGPSSAEISCFTIVEESHPKDDLISASLQNMNASLFAQFLLELETLDPLLYRLLSKNDGDKRYTFFLPTNNAWNDFLKEHPTIDISGELLAAIIKQHIMVEYIPYKNLLDGLPVASSLNSNIVRFSQDDTGCVRLNDSAYVTIVEDICSNGVIHLVNMVVIPDGGF